MPGVVDFNSEGPSVAFGSIAEPGPTMMGLVVVHGPCAVGPMARRTFFWPPLFVLHGHEVLIVHRILGRSSRRSRFAIVVEQSLEH